jgi:hypothetical protein
MTWSEAFARAYRDVPYEWMALRLAYRASSHAPLTVTLGVNGFGGVTESPLTVGLTLAWAEREAERLLR